MDSEERWLTRNRAIIRTRFMHMVLAEAAMPDEGNTAAATLWPIHLTVS
jgi:hypothetical protein